ncbi:unnamed protein product [Lepidochelys kempii]
MRLTVHSLGPLRQLRRLSARNWAGVGAEIPRREGRLWKQKVDLFYFTGKGKLQEEGRDRISQGQESLGPFIRKQETQPWVHRRRITGRRRSGGEIVGISDGHVAKRQLQTAGSL